MKKLATLVILVLFLATPVFADSKQAYQDYLFQFNIYRQKYSEFQIAKNSYEKFKTLESQNQALTATKTMMSQRTQVLHSYLTYLGERVAEEEGLTNVTRQTFQTLIRNELTFLEGHSQLIPSINSIDDAENISDELEGHYQVLSISIRQIIIGLSLGRISVISRNFDNHASLAQSIVNTNGWQLSSDKVNTINRWFLDIASKKSLYHQKVEEVNRDAAALTGYNVDDIDRKYNETLVKIGEAKQYLNDDINYLGEITRSMKYIQ